MLLQRLATAQVELASQRKADVGLELGGATARFVNLNWQASELEGQEIRISSARNRAEATQSTLESIATLAGDFLETLTGARDATLGQDIIRGAAENSLSGLGDLLNTSLGGVKLFGGLNSQVDPMPGYSGGSGQQAILDAFVANFGFTPTDPDVASITPDEMTNFVNGSFANLFSDGSWQSLWTQAAPANGVTVLSGSQRIDASSSGASGFAASLTQAFSMMLELGQSALRQDTFTALADTAMSLVARGQQQLIGEQTRIGLAQERLKSVSEGLESGLMTVEEAIEKMQGVDNYELATEISTLTTQLEASYALTGRLSKLSLLSYI